MLAPLYDMLCTAVYEHLTPKMAMKLGSKYKFTEVQARHWDQFAQAAGLSKAQTKKRVLQIAQQLPAVARSLQATQPFARRPIINKMVELMDQRAALTIRRLTEGEPVSQVDDEEA
jgi:serine/threonine-protein kinase HipA